MTADTRNTRESVRKKENSISFQSNLKAVVGSQHRVYKVCPRRNDVYGEFTEAVPLLISIAFLRELQYQCVYLDLTRLYNGYIEILLSLYKTATEPHML